MVKALVNENAAPTASDAAALRAEAERLYKDDPRLSDSADALQLLIKATGIEDRLGIAAQTRKKPEAIEIHKPVLEDWFTRKRGPTEPAVRKTKRGKGGFKRLPDQLTLF